MSAQQSTALMALQEQYPPNKFNLLLPTTTAADVVSWHRMSVSIVTVDPNPLKGDVYQVVGRKNTDDDDDSDVTAGSEALFCLSRPATDRVGNAAGVGYDPNRSKALVLTPDQVVYETVGGIRRPDGSWVAFKATKELDLRVIEAELRDKARKKLLWGFYGDQAKTLQRYYKGKWETVSGKNGSQYQRFFIDPEHVDQFISDTAASQMVQWRKNKVMRCETGARLRVIRGLLGIRLQYTQAELMLPFAVPRIDFTPDMNDPTVKKAVLVKGLRSQDALYGTGRGGHDLDIPDDAISEAPADDDVMDADFKDMGEATGGHAEGLGQTPPPAGPQASQNGPASPTEPAPGAPGGAQPPTDQPKADDKRCAECGVELTDNTFNYSVRTFKRPLCWNHQRKGGAQA